MKDILNNIDKIHTTTMGIDRIKRNLNIDGDVVKYCINIITNKDCKISLEGKNYYCELNNTIITVNKYTYTIITAHNRR